MADAGSESIDVDLDAWDSWTPREAALHLARLEAPWYVAAGWALDLVLGRRTREHDDLEIGVPAHRFAEGVADDRVDTRNTPPDVGARTRRRALAARRLP